MPAKYSFTKDASHNRDGGAVIDVFEVGGSWLTLVPRCLPVGLSTGDTLDTLIVI
jgi:hypothetical protein